MNCRLPSLKLETLHFSVNVSEAGTETPMPGNSPGYSLHNHQISPHTMHGRKPDANPLSVQSAQINSIREMKLLDLLGLWKTGSGCSAFYLYKTPSCAPDKVGTQVPQHKLSCSQIEAEVNSDKHNILYKQQDID